MAARPLMQPLDISPEQQRGVEFLRARRVAGLFDRPGFGKTAQFVRAIDALGASRVTILCPPAVTLNERAEYEKWSLIGLPVTVLRSGKDEIPRDGVVICNFVLAATPGVAKRLAKRGCDVLVLDESHHLKNPRGARTKAVFRAQGIASSASRVWFITGTPAPNDASEYFVFAKVSGAWPGTRGQFVERYCLLAQSNFGEKIIGSRNDTRAELLAMLAPHALGRDGVEDGRSELTIDSAPVEGVQPDYSDVDPVALAEIESAIAAGSWKALDGPAVATVRRITGIAKASGVAAMARAAMDAGHKQCLIFAEHTAVIDILADALSEFVCGVVDGRTPAGLKERIISDFEPGTGKPPPQFRIAICQRMALKEGRTLTGATRVILAEPFWTPEDNNQMIARAWRRGQNKPVHASFAHLPGSIDEAITRTLARKSADIAQLKIVS